MPKKLPQTVEDCFICPYQEYRKEQRGFYCKFKGRTLDLFNQQIPDWCPLEDA